MEKFECFMLPQLNCFKQSVTEQTGGQHLLRTHRSLDSGLATLDPFKLLHLPFIYIFFQLPCGIFIGQRAPLH